LQDSAKKARKLQLTKAPEEVDEVIVEDCFEK
jgi:hypothetical protein